MQIDPKDLQFANVVTTAEVKKLFLRGVIRRDEQEDFASELMLQLLTECRRHDQAPAPIEAMINQIVTTRIVSILRKRHAKKRAANVEPLADRDVGRDARVGNGADPLRIVELRIDLKAALERLRPQDREICDLLLREAVTPAARELGIPRSTLRDAIAKIRDVFRDAGLDKYLQ